jgi:hypothetical protein
MRGYCFLETDYIRLLAFKPGRERSKIVLIIATFAIVAQRLYIIGYDPGSGRVLFLVFNGATENTPCTNIKKDSSTPAGSHTQRLRFTKKYTNAIPQQAIKNGTATLIIPAGRNSSTGIYIEPTTGIVRSVSASRSLRNIIM